MKLLEYSITFCESETSNSIDNCTLAIRTPFTNMN